MNKGIIFISKCIFLNSGDVFDNFTTEKLSDVLKKMMLYSATRSFKTMF